MHPLSIESHLWIAMRDRLADKGLLPEGEAVLSVRLPGRTQFYLGGRGDSMPVRIDWTHGERSPGAEVHAAIYRARPDVGAIARINSAYSDLLVDFGGTLPQVFDEQARHIGPMPPRPVDRIGDIAAAVAGRGNALLFRTQTFCFGMTPNRLTLNAELAEKCAKAFVLAIATGARVRQIPWLVRHVANGRLDKDKRRAVTAFAQGKWPEDAKGY